MFILLVAKSSSRKAMNRTVRPLDIKAAATAIHDIDDFNSMTPNDWEVVDPSESEGRGLFFELTGAGLVHEAVDKMRKNVTLIPLLDARKRPFTRINHYAFRPRPNMAEGAVETYDEFFARRAASIGQPLLTSIYYERPMRLSDLMGALQDFDLLGNYADSSRRPRLELIDNFGPTKVEVDFLRHLAGVETSGVRRKLAKIAGGVATFSGSEALFFDHNGEIRHPGS